MWLIKKKINLGISYTVPNGVLGTCTYVYVSRGEVTSRRHMKVYQKLCSKASLKGEGYNFIYFSSYAGFIFF